MKSILSPRRVVTGAGARQIEKSTAIAILNNLNYMLQIEQLEFNVQVVLPRRSLSVSQSGPLIPFIHILFADETISCSQERLLFEFDSRYFTEVSELTENPSMTSLKRHEFWVDS